MKKILTGEHIRRADAYTIAHEPIASIDLMERASRLIAERIMCYYDCSHSVLVVVGKGNNGGDGLAIARLLNAEGYRVTVFAMYDYALCSNDYQTNYMRLDDAIQRYDLSHSQNNMSELFNEVIARSGKCILIDALLGSGVVGRPNEYLEKVIRAINELTCEVVAVDMPSGLSTEFNEPERCCVKATLTVSIQTPKLAFLLPSCGDMVGDLEVVDISISTEYIEQAPSDFFFLEEQDVQDLIPIRRLFGYKNEYGHALLVCGSEGMMGAAVLATGGALRSGCGLVSTLVPQCCANVIFSTHPSALVCCGEEQLVNDLLRFKFQACGVGCGLGTDERARKLLVRVLELLKGRLVLDADAITMIAKHKFMMSMLPQETIFTPHLGELRRLIGDWISEEEMLIKVREFCVKYRHIVIVKGAYTAIVHSDGTIYFNPFANPGLAKGGSGDVLCGLITGLLARGLSPRDAAIVGVFRHAVAGKSAKERVGVEAMNSGDLYRFL